MACPFFKPSFEVQEEHVLYKADMRNLKQLQKSLDLRVIHYCQILEAHKKKCPICSWPRLYPIWRHLCQSCTKIFQRKIFWGGEMGKKVRMRNIKGMIGDILKEKSVDIKAEICNQINSMPLRYRIRLAYRIILKKLKTF